MKENQKKMAESLSIEYRSRLEIAKEEDGEVKVATFIRSLTQVEFQRTIFRNIIVMEDKSKVGYTLRVKVTKKMGQLQSIQQESLWKRLLPLPTRGNDTSMKVGANS